MLTWSPCVNQLILVTNNVSDYREFQGLKVENWHY